MTTGLCSIKEVHHGQSVVDGAGVKINRLVGSFDVEEIGPFVMNTEEDIRQAFADYRSGDLF